MEKELAELKELLSAKVEDLKEQIKEIQKELDGYQRLLAKIDMVLEKESFKTAAELYEIESKGKVKELEQKPKPTKSVETVIEKEFDIKTDDDKLLGKMVVEKSVITIIPSQDIKIPEDAAPFKNFFLGKILKQMEEEDQDGIKSGKIDKKELILYEIIKSPENNIQKIIIKNCRNYNRMIKILNTINWTFKTILKPK